MPTSPNSLVKVYYSPIEAAIRWSGLYRYEQFILARLGRRPTPDQEDFPRWPRLHLNCGRIYNALINDDLPYGKNGVTCHDPCLLDDPELTIREVDLKAWMMQRYPEEKPSFLFGWAERHQLSQTAIERLMTENAALKVHLSDCSKECKQYKQSTDELQLKVDDLIRKMSPEEPLSERGRSALLNIIGGLLTALRGSSSSGQRYSQFDSDAAIIEIIIFYHRGRVGISERTMQKHFAAARRSLAA